jgi:hypothetical protein
MSARRTKFILVRLNDDWGFNEQSFPALRDIVSSAKPDCWDFLNPGTFMAYFLPQNDGAQQAKELIDKAMNLAKSDSNFSGLSIEKSECELLAEFDWRGKLKSSPIGIPANRQLIWPEMHHDDSQ